MSASSRVVRNVSTRRQAIAGGSIYRARNPRTSFVPALAILVPRRDVSTETTPNSGGAPAGPPPGFNAQEAKKPLNQDKEAKNDASSMSKAAPGLEETTATSTSATGVDKTRATQNQSLAEMAAEKATATKKEEQKLEAKKPDAKKLTLMQKVKKEVLHYWDGTKLLCTEVKISSRLALKMAAGYELSRREHRQLQRTVQDLGRLVPFSVFVIVPFAELLLPVALRLFPNLLPSTYEGQKAKDTKATNLRTTRKEVSSFLRQTLKETGLPLSPANAQKEEFTTFFRKVRATGESPTRGDVIKVCQIFKDDLTLDNLSRPQLVGMTRYMNLNTFGTDMVLRYQIRHRMRQIKRDDRAISFEGVESLSVPELQMACASRGLRTHGMSPGRLRDDLQMWLDLRLKYGVPSTLLVLSNAFMYAQGKDSEMNSQIDALTGVLSSIPEELFHEIELEVHNAEGAATNKQRLEVLKEQQELIEEENEQNNETASVEGGQPSATPKDNEDIDEKEEKKDDDQSAKAESQQASEARDAEADGEASKKDQDKEAVASEQEKK
ncbi:MAG: Glycoside hydrolase, 38 vacuolar alpha mannosidase [Chaenotheca gracillima]|nr:MAG: Glycoside hydrolase, 38 vacuolar alpha mannosidase [Chaenotheca gracillima]